MGSGFNDWIYWHFFTITINYNISHIELLLNDICLTNLYEESLTPIRISNLSVATDGQAVSLDVKPNLGPMTRYLLLFYSYGLAFCGAPSLARGRVCHLYMLLALASAVFLGFESLGTRDHILVSQI
jgi:hypothetical protein